MRLACPVSFSLHKNFGNDTKTFKNMFGNDAKNLKNIFGNGTIFLCLIETQWKSRIIPIEVKSGKTGHLKSMRLFMNQSRTPAALRFHAGNLHIQDIERSDGSTYKLISLPFYLVHRFKEVLEQFI
jgi:hypothetical protein